MTTERWLTFWREQNAIDRHEHHGPEQWDALLADVDAGRSHE